MYIGIPSPEERWVVVKLQFYWKLLHIPNITHLHKWAKTDITNDYKLIKQLKDLKTKYFPPAQNEEIDPFNNAEKPNEIRPKIITMQNKTKINKLHKYHPFNIINYIRSDYKSFNIYDENQLQSFVTKTMEIEYRELFYNFNNKSNHCNVCDNDIIEPHISFLASLIEI